MEERIQASLSEIETTHDVTVLYACESGSRAWGFASTDSDYDVRFIYLNRPAWYLAVDLEAKRDVIELPINDVLDVCGWDLRKTLQLFRKSNPPLLEWLGSPIIYRETHETAAKMRALSPTFYSPIACGYHYLHIAQGNYRDYLKGEMVKRKKYFYVLRPLLAIRWIEAGYGVVPTEFSKLVEATLPPGRVRGEIDALVAAKTAGTEKDRAPRIPTLNDFIESELTRLENSKFERPKDALSVEPLNELFQQELETVYGYV